MRGTKDDVLFGIGVRALRREQRLSQEKLSELADLSRQGVIRIEQGHSPRLSSARKLTAALGLDTVEQVILRGSTAMGEEVPDGCED